MVSFNFCFRKLLISGIGGLLGRTFPGRASALALLSHGAIETFLDQGNSLVTKNVLDKIERQSKSVVELKRSFSGKDNLLADIDLRTFLICGYFENIFFELFEAKIHCASEPCFFRQHCS